MKPTFRDIWQSWLEVSLLEPARDELEERRHAFYAGAIAMFGIFMSVEDAEEDAKYIKRLACELEAHTVSLGRRRQ